MFLCLVSMGRDRVCGMWDDAVCFLCLVSMGGD